MISPIPTKYRGVLHRSKREARWAVFFHALDIGYDYEAEGFQLPEKGWYLPDFYLPRFDCYVEIKGPRPTDEEYGKCEELRDQLHKDVWIFWGEIAPFGNWDYLTMAHERVMNRVFCEVPSTSFGYRANGDFELNPAWCECKHCGLLGISPFGNPSGLERLTIVGPPEHPTCRHSPYPWFREYASRRLCDAYEAARSYRF